MFFLCVVFLCHPGTISKLRRTVEEQQKALDAMAGMLLMLNMNCLLLLCDAGGRRGATSREVCSAGGGRVGGGEGCNCAEQRETG